MTESSTPNDTSPAQSEPTLGDRIGRLLSLLKRGRRHLLGAAIIFVLGAAAAAYFTLHTTRRYTSECTFIVRSVGRTVDQDPADAAAKRNARLKDMVYERPRLEATIRKFGLYPGLVESRGYVDAIEAMKPHVGLRGRESGRFVVSFDSYELPQLDTRALVRDVTQYLAESLVEDFVGGNVKDLRSDTDFLGVETIKAAGQVDESVQAVTVFLSAHPEFAVDVGTSGAPISASAAGLPSAKPRDPVVVVARQRDLRLAALFREQARLEADLRGGGPASPASGTRDAANTEVEAAKKGYAEAQADLVAKSAKLTPEHPDMRAAQANANAAALRLRDARSRLASIDAQGGSDVGAANRTEERAKLKQVLAQITAREAELAGGPRGAKPIADASTPPPQTDSSGDPHVALEIEWQRLLRAVGDAKSHLDDLKKRAAAADMALKSAEASRANAISIVEPAYRPTGPTNSRRTTVAVGGIVAAFAAALFYVMLRVLLYPRVVDVSDLEALHLGAVLGSIPHPRELLPKKSAEEETAESEANKTALARATSGAVVLARTTGFDPIGGPFRVIPVSASPKTAALHAVLEDDAALLPALRVIRHRLEVLRKEGVRRIAVTSAHDGDGKSSVAAQLAFVLAESQRAMVVLVEANFRRPSLAKMLGLDVPAGAGLSSQIVRKMRGGKEPWSVLALGESIHVMVEPQDIEGFPRALHAAHFAELLTTLSGMYEYVVIDGPSVLGSGDANAVETAVDGIVVVARSETTRKSDLRLALRQIGTRKAIRIVLVENGT